MQRDYSASIVKCAAYNQEGLFPKVREAIELIGGIEKFVKPNSKVLVKPNLLMAIEPERAITTHPEFVRAVIRILKDINCKIYLGDSPSVFGGHIEDILKVYDSTGMKQIADEEGAELVTFEKRFIPPFLPRDISHKERAGFMQNSFPLTHWLKECDYVVNLPKLKTHGFMVITGAVKNLFGLIPGTFKLECHKNFYQPEKFAGMLLDIYEMVKPALTIIDCIQGIEGDGPATSGIKRDFGLILAGSDALAADVVLAKVMNLKPYSIFTNQEAFKRKLASADLGNIEIKGEEVHSCSIPDIKLPKVSLKQALVYKLPAPVAHILKKTIYFHPKIDSDVCRLCEACVKNCPRDAIANKNGRIIIDYAQCISCFCCQEACPYAAIGTKKSFLARIMGM